MLFSSGGNWEVIICLQHVTSKSAWLSGLYISQYMHWSLDNCYQVIEIFISGYGEIFLFNFIKFTARCIYFVLILSKTRSDFGLLL